MNYIQINTSQNVNLSFELASIGTRMLAFILDWGFKIAYIIVFFVLPMIYLDLGKFLNSLDGFSAGAVVTLISLPVVFYTLILESLMEGQTLGKKITKTKVIKIDGYEAKFSDYLIRWFFMLIDAYFSSAAVGIISMVVNKNTQRLGGITSGTAVISLKERVNINHTILQEIKTDYKPTFPEVRLLKDSDIQIIKTHYQLAMGRRDFKMVKTLAEKIQTVLSLQEVSLTPQVLIETVIKDYNYYMDKSTQN